MFNLSILIISAALTAGLVVLLRRAMIGLGLVDHPGERKSHLGSVPLHGGLCMALVIVFAGVALFLNGGLSPLEWALLLGLSVFAVIGVLDDLYDLPAVLRLILEVTFLYWLMTALDFRIVHLGNLWGFGDVQLGAFASVFTLFTIFCLINGINMLDGMDGLSAGISAIAIACFLLASAMSAVLVSPLLWAVLGALLGFLFFNARSPWREKAVVFMGDAGSLVLGFVLSWCCVAYSQADVNGGAMLVRPITAVWILALPIIDTVYVVIHRIRTGKGIFTAGSDHIHFRLRRRGYSDTRVVSLLWLITLLLGGLGLMAELLEIPEWVMCYGFIALSIAYYFRAAATQNIQMESAK